MLVAILAFANASQAAPESGIVKQLEADRFKIFHATMDRPNSGWFIGDEGSHHDIYFPIGRADRMYYISNSATGYSGGKCEITCWTTTPKSYQKAWQLDLTSSATRKSAGTLYNLAATFGWAHNPGERVPMRLLGYHFDEKSREWKKARKEIEARANIIDYSYGIHGDVSLQAEVAVLAADGTVLARQGIDHMGRMVVPTKEIELMARANKP